jgi:alkanesulfonate monooxygenase SsuD/methylene tetrahydromethanopterin reductase-like flavin-dependent oxidoreductase (luciferase family)
VKIGIYLNSQYPADEPAAAALDLLREQTRTAANLGFDSIWAGEHHLTHGYHFFPQLTLLSHLAAYSGDMTLGTNLVLLPLHRPVDIAEQVAMIDLACEGRFILTVGQGYREEEFAAMGTPFAERLARMLDGIDTIRGLWSGQPYSHDSGWYSVENATVLPGPATDGGPPIWIGATTDRAIRRAGGIGDGFMATPNADIGEIVRQAGVFAAGRADAGLPPTDQVGRMLEVHCHRDADEAVRRSREHLLRKYASYASWGNFGVKNDSGSTPQELVNADKSADFAALAEGRFVIGTPDDVVAGLVAQHEQASMAHLAMRISWPGSNPEHALECLELLGSEVLPRVRAELG